MTHLKLETPPFKEKTSWLAAKQLVVSKDEAT
jgi:hypothetical protein